MTYGYSHNKPILNRRNVKKGRPSSSRDPPEPENARSYRHFYGDSYPDSYGTIPLIPRGDRTDELKEIFFSLYCVPDAWFSVFCDHVYSSFIRRSGRDKTPYIWVVGTSVRRTSYPFYDRIGYFALTYIRLYICSPPAGSRPRGTCMGTINIHVIGHNFK